MDVTLPKTIPFLAYSSEFQNNVFTAYQRTTASGCPSIQVKRELLIISLLYFSLSQNNFFSYFASNVIRFDWHVESFKLSMFSTFYSKVSLFFFVCLGFFVKGVHKLSTLT